LFTYFLENNTVTQNCLELLAIDFLPDVVGNIFLIEVNSCPNMNHFSEDQKVFMEELAKSVVDVLDNKTTTFWKLL